MGVYACNANGMWEDHSGTSFAAPLLAQKAAVLFDHLQHHCPAGGRPFAAAVKALLFVTATREPLPERHEILARRCLGRGEAQPQRLVDVRPDDALLVWQGVLGEEKETARVQLPIPLEWIREADEPRLEICAAWETPCNAAVESTYGSRDVVVRLRPAPDDRAVYPLRSPSIKGYPLRLRTYNLGRIEQGRELAGDTWLVDVSYHQAGEYHVNMDFTPEQRVGLAFRLWDAGESTTSPQTALQALPVTASMVRLAAPPVPARVPVFVKSMAGV